LASGCIETIKKDSLFARYQTIQTELSKILTTYRPTECGIESVFFSNNTSTAIQTGEIRGIILGCLFQHQVRASNYTPTQIKSAITGNGRATKSEVERMVLLLTKCEKLPKLDDEVDAIAAALCHAASRGLKQLA
jgi:crossover junction endodeoxyribonuclease RuvC